MLVCADVTSQSGHSDTQTTSVVPLHCQYFLAKRPFEAIKRGIKKRRKKPCWGLRKILRSCMISCHLHNVSPGGCTGQNGFLQSDDMAHDSVATQRLLRNIYILTVGNFRAILAAKWRCGISNISLTFNTTSLHWHTDRSSEWQHQHRSAEMFPAVAESTKTSSTEPSNLNAS